MLATYSSALAPGTYANRVKQAQSFLRFAGLYNVDFLNPSIVHACMYSQYLANVLKTVSAVKNYLSGALSWIYEHSGNPQAFNTSQVDHMLKSITKRSNHVVKRAFPLTLPHIRVIAIYLVSSRSIPLAVKAAVLLGFSCYLRTSNLLFPNFSLFNSNHTLLAKHVTINQNGLKVVVLSTKSLSHPYVIDVTYNPDTLLCPVLAWIRYVNSLPLHPNGPAFMVNWSTPLTSDVVVKFMREALKQDPDVDVTAILMHSLRRGAAQTADKAGVPISQIMKRGGWKSKSGLKPYLTS